MKNVLKSMFEPSGVMGFVIFNMSIGTLICVFINNLEGTWLAYVSYLASAYALIIFIVWFCKVCKFSGDYIRKSSYLYRLYSDNSKMIAKLALAVSLIGNLFYGVFKLAWGIYYGSPWFITFAVYYILLFAIKFSLIWTVRKNDFGTNLSKEYEKLKHAGVILLFLNLILTGMIILIIHQNRVIEYTGHLIYLVALLDFYFIICAFINVFKYKKKKSPVLVASKCINLSVAMISMISLEVAMISQFGSGDDNFKLIMISCTGFGICLINSLMGIYMIIESNKNLSLKKIHNRE